MEALEKIAFPKASFLTSKYPLLLLNKARLAIY